MLAEGGLVGVLDRHLAAAAGTTPKAGRRWRGRIRSRSAIPSLGREPVVSDVSMGAVTYGDVIAGHAATEELVPFGGDQSHKAFALAVGLAAARRRARRRTSSAPSLLVARPESRSRAGAARACRRRPAAR